MYTALWNISDISLSPFYILNLLLAPFRLLPPLGIKIPCSFKGPISVPRAPPPTY